MAARKPSRPARRRPAATKKKAAKPTYRSAPPESSPFPSCAKKATTEGYADLPGKAQLQLASCCFYVNDVLENGYTNSHTETKAVLKRFMTLLANEKSLLDYCFIQFDVKDDKIKGLMTNVATFLKE